MINIFVLQIIYTSIPVLLINLRKRKMSTKDKVQKKDTKKKEEIVYTKIILNRMSRTWS